MKYLPATLAFTLLFSLTFFLSPVQAQESSAPAYDDNVVEIVGEDFALQAPEVIPSGWTTIEYVNEGEEPHFLFLARLPEGHTFEEYANEVVAPFNDVWYLIRDEGAGPEQAMEELGAKVPEWYWGVEFLGGAGIIEPGASSKVTLNLPPGTYVLECYMKTEDGEMHNMEGMLRGLTVTEETSEVTPPDPDLTVTLSNFEMDIEGPLTPGSKNVAVHVKENPEEGFGHNVHVAKLEGDVEAEEVIEWMNFFDPEGLQPPAPTTFHGGMHLLPAGETGYFNLDLEPGRYLFVSEYTAPFGVWQEVTVER